MHDDDNQKKEPFESALLEPVSTEPQMDIEGLAGSAGLTFEAPVVEKSDVQIGFAHELLENVTQHPEFAYLDQGAADVSQADVSLEHSFDASFKAEHEKPRGAFVEYPLAKAALARLLAQMKNSAEVAAVTAKSVSAADEAAVFADDFSALAGGPQKDFQEAAAAVKSEVPAAFTIGSEVMRRPAKVQTPAALRETPHISPESSGQMQEMVDLFFVGADDEAQEEQIHLQFKEDVLGGLYLTLKKTDAGMVAHFVVQDANTRRLVESQAHMLAARLQKKGMRIVDTVVEVQGGEKALAQQNDYFSGGDQFDEF